MTPSTASSLFFVLSWKPKMPRRGHGRFRRGPMSLMRTRSAVVASDDDFGRCLRFQDKTKNNDDAVEGVILMRRGEQTQNVLEGVERKTEEINKTMLPRDVRVRPFYDRSDLVRVTTDTVEGNLLRGMIFVLIVLIFFLVSIRAAVITALTIPLALLFAFIFLHLTGEAANLLSIGAIDFWHHH